ncbi:uncharacterized protein N7511_007912 [Penicillium nucicola]|uniref:uncharacterized protein n=1 Tax=Penicillium nucicola TaxID=1850975 RepID=UPI0025459DFA|nr:uncharacterized protein N7511_007912 [Penicillium nucicola]KAJ5753759.1 hypothetical protein N7511_007912 [Penicillium nucicola]
MALDNTKLLQTLEKATELKLCPNRLWAVAGENLPNIFPNFNSVASLTKQQRSHPDYKDHGQCTSDFCEYSQRDFSAVQQRHECRDAKCRPLRSQFPRYALDRAARDGTSTVWALNGISFLKSPVPYMAISHVWSDGTGTGAWKDGAVNQCLYAFFRDIAEKFECEGIWWDTLCIPREKAARNKAIQKIQVNYEDARITLVHDCFLRNWEWDPKTACFAILMSPWFSRGWTALELTKSRKVKVIFKGREGPVIKDLDEEILAKEGSEDTEIARKNASQIIRNLRGEVTSLNDLLSVLGARYTSWPKDMATISALLVGVKPQEQQQETYKSIVKRFGRIAPGHLFHNTATMSKGLRWCPANLFHIPLDSSPASLVVSQEGHVSGSWRLSRVRSGLVSDCWWGDTHALVRLQIQSALETPQDCRLLAERGTNLIERALLVKKMKLNDCYQYIGAVYFRQALDASADNWVEKEVIISGYMDHEQEGDSASTSDEDDINVDDRNISEGIHKPERLRSAIWRGDWHTFNYLKECSLLDAPDEIGRRPLHLAAERGHIKMVQVLLDSGATPSLQCDQGRTALHSAVWGGSAAIVQLLQERIDDMTQDKDGNIALHIAAQMGAASVAELLINKSTINAAGFNDLTPLHFAVINGHKEVIESLKYANLSTSDRRLGLTPLHCAVGNGHKAIVELLIDYGAELTENGNLAGWTPVHIAAINGERSCLNALLDAGADGTAEDKFGWTPRQFAEINGHTELLEFLPGSPADSVSKDSHNWTPLHCKAINKDDGIVKMLTSKDVDAYLTLPGQSWQSPLQFAAENELGTALQWLFQKGFQKETESQKLTLFWAAANGCKEFAHLLLDQGAHKEGNSRIKATPLLIACHHGHDSIVQVLLEAGANKERRSSLGKTPLHVAALRGHEAVVLLLLDFGANKLAVSHSRRTPLFYAAHRGHEGVVRLLLDVGVPKDGRTGDSKTPLQVAARAGHEKVVRLLLEAGETGPPLKSDASDRSNEWEDTSEAHNLPSDVSFDNSYEASDVGRYDTDVSVDDGRQSVSEGTNESASEPSRLDSGEYSDGDENYSDGDENYSDGDENYSDGDENDDSYYEYYDSDESLTDDRIQHGMDRDPGYYVMHRILARRTPLNLAAKSGHSEAVRLLLDAGGESAQGLYLQVALLSAAKKGHRETVRLLVEANAGIAAEDNNTATALFCAATQGNTEALKLLIAAESGNGNAHLQLPLCAAAAQGYEEAVRLLLDAGANIATARYGDYALLSLLAIRGKARVLKMLIDTGADVNEYEEGIPPLSAAATTGEEEVMRLLVDAGADVNDVHQGATALYLAARRNNISSVQFLLEEGADVDLMSGERFSPLLCAADKGHDAVLRLLLHAGADIHRYDTSPLLCAVEKGHEAVVRLLLEAGADKEVRGYQGRTALDYARLMGHYAIIKLLAP